MFYIPDPFAWGLETFPETIQAFQNFNLVMSRKSGRTIDPGIDISSALKMLSSLPQLGFKWSTCSAIASHLASERINPWKTSRCRVFQSLLSFDRYKTSQAGQANFYDLFYQSRCICDALFLDSHFSK